MISGRSNSNSGRSEKTKSALAAVLKAAAKWDLEPRSKPREAISEKKSFEAGRLLRKEGGAKN